MEIKKIRYLIFLRDVAWLSVTAFGGPQVHLAMFLDMFVKKRRYLKEEDFMELNALCMVLPGPTSSQTIVALGYKIGGPSLAYLTLLVWSLPGVLMMTALGLLISYFDRKDIPLHFFRFVHPIAIGFVWFAALRVSTMVVKTKTAYVLMFLSALAAYGFRSPWVFPLVVVFGGLITSLKFKNQPKLEKDKIRIQWGNFILFWGVLITAAVLGALTKSLPVRIFENFYRNGSFIFGGGQVLIPVLYTEFVKFKAYLSAGEFLIGFGLSPFVPGPVFSFAAFIGALSMRDYGVGGQITGALVASAGIFLPGTFLIFFVIRFWEQVKKYRVVKASLEGINAASSGLVLAAAVILFLPLTNDLINILLVVVSFLMLRFTKIPQYILILAGLLAGAIYSFIENYAA